MRAFRVLGIDVHLDYSWLFIFALILWNFAFGYFPALYPGLPIGTYLLVGMTSTLLFFGSVLFHEMSHSLVANRHGVQVDRITLFIFGGVSHLKQESPNPAVEIRIAAAGPLASFILGAAFLGAAWMSDNHQENIWAGMAQHLGILNIALGAFNLLPGFPLDGGRVLRALSWSRSGSRLKATAVAAAWGKGLGWGLIALGALGAFQGRLLEGIWMVFIGLFLKEAAEAERRQVVMGDVVAGMRVSGMMTSDPIAIPLQASVQEAVQVYFLRHGHGGYPVTRDGRAVGLISLADLTKCPPENRQGVTVAQIMTPLGPEQMTWPDEPLSVAMRKMAEAGVSRLPVLDSALGGRLVGLLTLRSVLRQIKLREIASDPRSRAA